MKLTTSLLAVLCLYVCFSSCAKDKQETPTAATATTQQGADRDLCSMQIRLQYVSGSSSTEPELSVYNSANPWGYVINFGAGCMSGGGEIAPWRNPDGSTQNDWQTIYVDNNSTVTVTLEDISTPAYDCEGEYGYAVFYVKRPNSSTVLGPYTLYYNDNNGGPSTKTFSIGSSCTITPN